MLKSHIYCSHCGKSLGIVYHAKDDDIKPIAGSAVAKHLNQSTKCQVAERKHMVQVDYFYPKLLTGPGWFTHTVSGDFTDKSPTEELVVIDD